MLNSFRFAASLTAVLLLLGGCASKSKVDAEPFEPVPQLGIETTNIVPDVRWSASLATDDDLIFSFSPVVTADSLCAAGQRAVACFDLNNGDRRWLAKQKGLSAGVAVNDTTLVAAVGGGRVIAWDLKTGEKLWTADAGAEVTATPAIGTVGNDSVVVVNTGAGRVRAFSAADGELLWGHEQQVPALTLRGNATPVIHESSVLVGFDSGHLMSIELLDGQINWDMTVGRPEGRTELDRMVDIDSAAVVRRNDVYSSAYNTHTRALDLKSGREIWNKRVSGGAGAAVDDKRLYVSSGDNQVYALDVYSGRVIWQQGTFSDTQEQRRFSGLLTAPVLYKDYVLLADSQGYLHALDASTGTRVFSSVVSKGVSAAPQIHGDSLVLQDRSGKIKMIDLVTLKASDAKGQFESALDDEAETHSETQGLFN